MPTRRHEEQPPFAPDPDETARANVAPVGCFMGGTPEGFLLSAEETHLPAPGTCAPRLLQLLAPGCAPVDRLENAPQRGSPPRAARLDSALAPSSGPACNGHFCDNFLSATHSPAAAEPRLACLPRSCIERISDALPFASVLALREVDRVCAAAIPYGADRLANYRRLYVRRKLKVPTRGPSSSPPPLPDHASRCLHRHRH